MKKFKVQKSKTVKDQLGQEKTFTYKEKEVMAKDEKTLRAELNWKEAKNPTEKYTIK